MPAPSLRLAGRRTLVGGVAVLALSGLAACGGGGDDSDAGSTPASASSSTSDSSSTTLAIDLKPGDDVSASEMTSIYKKAMTDVSSAHMTMTGKLSVAGQSLDLDAEGDLTMNPMAEDMTMTMMGQKMHVVLVDGTEYIQTGSGGQWMKVDLDDLAKQSGMGDLSSAFTNPLSMLDSMSGAISKATYVGSESDGDHYQLTLDMAKALKAFGSDTKATAGMPSSMDEDLWFDDDGHLAKMAIDMGSTGKIEGEMSDYGKSVDIQAPPASQVTEMPSAG